MLNPALLEIFYFSLYFISWFSFNFLSVFFCCFKVSVLAQAAASKWWGERSLKALAHIRMPDLCQYLFPSWFGSKSNTCYGGSGCCNHSRCCGWSNVAGCKCTVPHAIPGVLSLKLSNEKQCVLNGPHGDSQALWECGFWIMSKVWFLPTLSPPFFFPFFHEGVNTIWRGSRTLNREHWLVKLFPADASFIWRAGNSLARFSPQFAKELV